MDKLVNRETLKLNFERKTKTKAQFSAQTGHFHWEKLVSSKARTLNNFSCSVQKNT